MGVIVYELNEVPRRLFDFYADAFPRSALAKLRHSSVLFETTTADVGHLSPWITWPTMHRGVSNVSHEISELGQTLTHVNKAYPAVYETLAKNGVKVGVFGSLQSYPLPEDLKNFSFYVPDTFAAGDECFPGELADFQAFNLSMVRTNGRNVGNGIAVKSAARFLKNSINLGLTPKTLLKLSNQILGEQLNRKRLVRRRTSQVEIAFDLYFHQLRTTQPDISFFFTNHVASSMHRYWPTVFPDDYEDGKFDLAWLQEWSEEIPHAIKVANFQLQMLMDYCDQSNAELIVCSSMGQDAVVGVEPLERQVLITNVKKLLRYVGLSDGDWEPKLAMAPRVVITPKNHSCINVLERLTRMRINGAGIDCHQTSSGDVRLEISLSNQSAISISYDGKEVPPYEVGIENVELQDASGSYAYHIPEGILIHYHPNGLRKTVQDEKWRRISVLDFAPSILAKFSVAAPPYMEKEHLFSSNSSVTT